MGYDCPVLGWGEIIIYIYIVEKFWPSCHGAFDFSAAVCHVLFCSSSIDIEPQPRVFNSALHRCSKSQTIAGSSDS